jgi:GH24 family phage-related lysozyme (muramidase)
MNARRADAESSLLQQVDMAASQPDEDAKAVMGGVRATLQDMVDTEIISVEEAAGRSVGYAQQYASLKIAGIAKQDPDLAVSVLRDEQPGPAMLIRQLFSFRPTAYWHEEANRAGYGADTITREDGTVAKIVPGMTVARADAERDLQRRIEEFRTGVGNQVGGKVFERLAPHVQAALVSVGYSTGVLPDKVTAAVRSGDAEAIAAAIEASADEDGSVNQQVRLEQAAIVRGDSGNSYDQIARRPLWAGVLEPEQRSGLLDAASREVERQDARRA